MPVSRYKAIAILAAAIVFCVSVGLELAKDHAEQNAAARARASKRFDADVLRTTQTLASEQQASGLSEIFEMLKNGRPFESARIAAGRHKVDELLHGLDAGSARVEQAKTELVARYPQEDKPAELATTKIQLAISIKRRYLDEVGHLMDFLTEKAGTYYMTPDGMRFKTEDDARTFNTMVDQIKAQELDMDSRRSGQANH